MIKDMAKKRLKILSKIVKHHSDLIIRERKAADGDD